MFKKKSEKRIIDSNPQDKFELTKGKKKKKGVNVGPSEKFMKRFESSK